MISAFAFGGIPKKAVKKAFSEAEIYVSPAILREYREVPLALLSDGRISYIQFKALISGIAAFVAKAKVVEPQNTLNICRNPEDNMLLECCLEAEADILISGDKDILEINEIPFKLHIFSPRRFSEKNKL